jgi:hypothetical protein
MLSCRLAILFLVPLLAAAQSASLQGTTVDAFSHQPLGKVHIRLLKTSSHLAGDVFGAMSDDEGHFSIANLPPGSYTVIPEHAGFVATPAAKNPRAYPGVTLRAGENLSVFKVELTPAATIRGRVVDENGDPLPRARVQIEAPSPNDASFNVQPGGAFTQTDDRGAFAATGFPGRYYVSANPFRGARPGAKNEIRTDGTTEAVYLTTYFPNSMSKEGATLVEVKPGEESAPLEIRMSRQQNLSISGVVSGMPAGAHPVVVLVHTVSTDGASGSSMVSSFGSSVDEDGRFSFSRLVPGSYRLHATLANQQPPLQSQIQSVAISNADVSAIVLLLKELGEIAGVVEVAGSKTALRGNVQLTSRDPSAFEPVRSSAPIDKDGSFHIARVAAIRHQVAIDPLPENAYIESVVVDGVAQGKTAEFEMPAGSRATAVKIIVNSNGGQLSGTIVNQDGSVMTGSASTVYLVQDPKDMPRARSTRVKDDGSYMIQGIRPGKYHLFVTRDQRALSDLAARAEEIDIQAGDRLTKKLTPVPTEAPSAKPRP